MSYNKSIWKKKRGKDGKIHYYNLITGKTRLYLKGGYTPYPNDEEHEKLKKIMNRLIDLRCAISSVLITDPISIGTKKENKNIVYERARIEEWFNTRRRERLALNCPSTRIGVNGVITPEPDRSREIALFVEKYKDVRFQGPSWDEIREDCAEYLEAIQGNDHLLQIQNEAHTIYTDRREAKRERLRREAEEKQREQERLRREREEEIRREEEETLLKEYQERLQREDPDQYELLCTLYTLQEAPPRSMLNKQCQLCTDKMSNNDVLVTLDCGHLFHKECFNIWIENLKDATRNTSRKVGRLIVVKCPVCKADTSPPRDSVREFYKLFQEDQEIGKDKSLTLLENVEQFCPIISLGYLDTKNILSKYPKISEILLQEFENIWKSADENIISEQEAYEQNKLLLDKVEKDYWKRRKDLSLGDRQIIEILREQRILLEYPDIDDMVLCLNDVISRNKKPRQLKMSNSFSEIFLQRLTLINWLSSQKDSQALVKCERETKRFWDYESEKAKNILRKKLRSAISKQEKLEIIEKLKELEDFWNRDDGREKRLEERLKKSKGVSNKCLNAFGVEICSYGLPMHVYIQLRRFLEETWKYKSLDEDQETIKRIKEFLILMRYQFDDGDQPFLNHIEVHEEVRKIEKEILSSLLESKSDSVSQEELFTQLESSKKRAEKLTNLISEHEQKLENERKLVKDEKIEDLKSYAKRLISSPDTKSSRTIKETLELLEKYDPKERLASLERVALVDKNQSVRDRKEREQLKQRIEAERRLVELKNSASLDRHEAIKLEEERRKLEEFLQKLPEDEQTGSCVGDDCTRLSTCLSLLPPRRILKAKRTLLSGSRQLPPDSPPDSPPRQHSGDIPRLPSPERPSLDREAPFVRPLSVRLGSPLRQASESCIGGDCIPVLQRSSLPGLVTTDQETDLEPKIRILKAKRTLLSGSRQVPPESQAKFESARDRGDYAEIAQIIKEFGLDAGQVLRVIAIYGLDRGTLERAIVQEDRETAREERALIQEARERAAAERVRAGEEIAGEETEAERTARVRAATVALIERDRVEAEPINSRFAERPRAEAAAGFSSTPNPTPVYGLGIPRVGAVIPPVIGSPTMRFLGTREIERLEKERLEAERRRLDPAFRSITGYFTETMEKDKRDAVERAAEAAALERRARGEPDILGYVAERLYIAERLEAERLEKERLEAERQRAEAAPVYGLGRPRDAPITPVIGSPTMRFLGTREIERLEKERLKEERRRRDPAAVEREEDQILRNLFEERRKKLGPHHGSIYAAGWRWQFARWPGEVDEWKVGSTEPSLFPWSEEKKIPPKPTKPPPDIPGYYEWNPHYGGYWMGDPIPGRKRYKYWFYRP
jgi:hypothetical protein